MRSDFYVSFQHVATIISPGDDKGPDSVFALQDKIHLQQQQQWPERRVHYNWCILRGILGEVYGNYRLLLCMVQDACMLYRIRTYEVSEFCTLYFTAGVSTTVPCVVYRVNTVVSTVRSYIVSIFVTLLQYFWILCTSYYLFAAAAYKEGIVIGYSINI